MFAEGLVTGRVFFAPVFFLGLVCFPVAGQTRRGQEGLAADAFFDHPVALEGSLVFMNAVHVLTKVLFLEVGLVAAFFFTLERSVVVVGPNMSGEASWPIEGTVAVFPGALDGLEV